MFRNGSKNMLKVILTMFFLSTSLVFANTITGNNSFNTAYPIGNWQYHSSIIGELKADETESYFSFRANRGDRVYVKVFHDDSDEGRTLEVFDQFQNNIGINVGIYGSSSFTPYLLVSDIDGTSSGQLFYIKVTRGNSTGSIFFSVSINNRMSGGLATFEFNGTAVNPGNPDILLNPNGVDSSVISMDLSNSSKIPEGAIVKSIKTEGRLSKNLGGIVHKISPSTNNIWYIEEWSNYNISESDELEVAQRWDFKYNFKGTSSSNMRDVKATIVYEYDTTLGFER
ncbi:hypothetical protein CP965_00705 [Halarcobacter mediterraneus]|uniref:Uncharacterized protein n=1 Tax=Halarcobacter mediterraneus TaxID=2023153 RepID=A0A4Q1B105_9BACT|nr:hypothetical protein [Halarcobacter mediterraneus]RXK14001.1 hypothetical protein CP965_00705 [Halarcobacter mediterraneus]